MTDYATFRYSLPATQCIPIQLLELLLSPDIAPDVLGRYLRHEAGEH